MLVKKTGNVKDGICINFLVVLSFPLICCVLFLHDPHDDGFVSFDLKGCFHT
uniref:Uncharacterized protein n=1 Tax=Kalanchoe fedtschenkoi TaxID=63787 RepID=A0A7N0ZVV0_KALFE